MLSSTCHPPPQCPTFSQRTTSESSVEFAIHTRSTYRYIKRRMKAAAKSASISLGFCCSCKQSETYSTASSPRKDRRCVPDGYLSPFKAKRYHQDDLAKLLIENARRPLTDALSPSELKTLRAPLPSYASKKEAHMYMKKYLQLFDKAFFFGVVRKELRGVRLEHYPHPNEDDGSSAYFHLQSRTIAIRLEAKYGDKPRTLRSLLGDLPHEMLHAFLEIYTCDCGDCVAKGRRVRVEKTYGHRENFINSILAIQDAMMLNADWRLEEPIGLCVNDEIWESTWRPKRETLEAWGVGLVLGNFELYEMERNLLVKPCETIEEEKELVEKGRVAIKGLVESFFPDGPRREPVLLFGNKWPRAYPLSGNRCRRS